MKDDLISRRWLMESVNEGWIKFDTEKDENRFIHLVRDIAPSAEAENIEEFKKTLSRAINTGIIATSAKDVYSCGMRNGMRWCRSLIEDEPPKFEEVREWIPCSERLPEYGVEVLTINKDDEYEINHIIDEEDGEWFLDGVVAWMPLPKK